MLVKRNPPKKKKKKKLIQKIILDNKIRFPFPYMLEEEIRKAFTMVNPEYLALCKRRRLKAYERPTGHIITKEKKNGIWTSRKIPQWLFYWEYDGTELVVPRGAFQVVKKIFNRHGVMYKVINNRDLLESTNFRFKGKLKESKGQYAFLDYKAKNGILQAGTGTGKTVMFLFHCARVNQPTCIVVDTNELLEQWKNRIHTFLGIPKAKIGHIGGGKEKVKPITVALVQTLRNRTDLLNNFGFLGIDECHIAATESYSKVVNEFKGRYVMGLSATPRRKDGKTRVMLWFLGKIALSISRDNVEKLPATGFFVNTGYEGEICFRRKYSVALAEMVRDKKRNQLIIDRVLKTIDHFGVHLIMSKSSVHLEKLIELLPHHFRLISELLVGKVDKKKRKEIVARAMKNELKFIFATDKLIEKGFDEELMSVLHLTTPIADPDKVEQACGRVTRVPNNQKIKELKTKALIFYYFDSLEVPLRAAASKTSKRFQELGIKKQIIH